MRFRGREFSTENSPDRERTSRRFCRRDQQSLRLLQDYCEDDDPPNTCIDRGNDNSFLNEHVGERNIGLKKFNNGWLIGIEGIDAAGKRTQSLLLSSWLRDSQLNCKIMSFPDYSTRIGK